MTRKEITEWLETSKDETELHTPLVQIICVFEDESEITEVIFAVPIKWLVDYKNGESGRIEWDWAKVREWLENEYTSEDSQPILERAVLENKVAFWKTN